MLLGIAFLGVRYSVLIWNGNMDRLSDHFEPVNIQFNLSFADFKLYEKKKSTTNFNFNTGDFGACVNLPNYKSDHLSTRFFMWELEFYRFLRFFKKYA